MPFIGDVAEGLGPIAKAGAGAHQEAQRLALQFHQACHYEMYQCQTAFNRGERAFSGAVIDGAEKQYSASGGVGVHWQKLGKDNDWMPADCSVGNSATRIYRLGTWKECAKKV